MKGSKWWKMIEFSKILKHFTGPKQWDASFSSPPDKSYLRLWNKNILCGIYRNMEAFDFPMLRECSSWVSKNGAMKMFFWHHPQNVCWKICTVSGFLAVLRELSFYNVEWVKVRKISDVFCVKLYCKVNDIFLPVLWLWDFLQENMKLKDKLQISGSQSFIFWSKLCFLALF